MARRTVVCWNLARLFGSGGSPIEQALALGEEATTATAPQVQRKIQVIAAVIDQIAAAEGPPVLVGFIEIESAAIAAQIAREVTSVRLVDIDSAADDETGLALDGLNISLLMDPEVFDGTARLRSHVIDRTFDTRDVLEVDLGFSDDHEPVSVLVNHWPSRMIGEARAQRIAAAHYVARLVERKVRFSLREMWHPEMGKMKVPNKGQRLRRARTPVVVMGDFNDEIFDESISILRATPDLEAVTDDLQVRGRSDRDRFRSYVESEARLLNPYWSLAAGGGSYYRSPRWRTYDQILLSRGMVEDRRDSRMRYVAGSARVHTAETVDLPDEGAYQVTNLGGKPIKYEPEKDRGCSDHFPVLAALEL